jgi:hypothetical protein
MLIYMMKIVRVRIMQKPCMTCIYNCGHCRLGFTSVVKCYSHLSWADGISQYLYNSEGEEFKDEKHSSVLISYDSFCENMTEFLNYRYYEEMPNIEKQKLREKFPKIWCRYEKKMQKDCIDIRKQILKEYHTRWENEK